MPKYILIGLGIPLIVFLSMYLWSKLSEEAKNRAITSIFGIIAIAFVVLIGLLVF
jgi:TM2 domain-containing membrane protein YozV